MDSNPDRTEEVVEVRVLGEGPSPFASIEELASVSTAVVELTVLGHSRFVPIGDTVPETGEREAVPTFATSLSVARVEDILQTVERLPFSVGDSVEVGVFAVNPASTVTGARAEVARFSTPLEEGMRLIGFLAPLEPVGLPEAWGFVRSDLGQFEVETDDSLSYRGIGPIGERAISWASLVSAISDPGVLGSALRSANPSSPNRNPNAM